MRQADSTIGTPLCLLGRSGRSEPNRNSCARKAWGKVSVWVGPLGPLSYIGGGRRNRLRRTENFGRYGPTLGAEQQVQHRAGSYSPCLI
jgi:hypothetical protein